MNQPTQQDPIDVSTWMQFTRAVILFCPGTWLYDHNWMSILHPQEGRKVYHSRVYGKVCCHFHTVRLERKGFPPHIHCSWFPSPYRCLSWVLWHKLTVEKAPGLLYRTCLKEGECIPPVKKAPVLTVSQVSDESSFTTEAPHSCSILSSSSVEDGCKITVSHTCTPCPRQSSLSGGSQFLF